MTTSFYEIFEKSRTNPSIYKNIESSFDLELLRNTLKTIIEQDPAQVRNYINTLNSFVFSKKFEVVPRANFIYNRPFNHNGQFLYFPEERMLFTIDNYAKGSKSEDNYEMKVFRNGELLTPDKHYTAITSLGSKRIFVKASLVSEFDVITVTASRKYNLHQGAFYTINVPTSNYAGDFEYIVDIYNSGKFFDNPDYFNLFIKKFNAEDSSFEYLERNVDYQISRLSATQVLVKVLIDVSKNDQLLVVNKLANYRLTFDTTNTADDQTYMEENLHLLNIPLRFYDESLEEYIPFPMDNINELDVWGAGGKLIPDEDYTLIKKDPVLKIPVLKINGFILKDSRILVESRLWDTMYNIAMVGTHIDNIHGYIPLQNANIPADSRYVEVFLGRRKVSQNDVSVIADCILKVDKQRCLEKLDVRTSLLISETFQQLNDDFKNSKSDLAEVVQNIGVNDFLATYTTNNNPTTNLTDKEPLEPFLPGTKVVEIRIELTNPSFIQGIEEPTFRIIAVFENEIELDITEFSIVEITDLSDLRDPSGEGTITARYTNSEGTLLEDDATFIFEEKEIYGVMIELESAVIEQGETPKYTVHAMYFDNTKRDITDRPNLVVNYPNTSSTGNKVITATYTVGSEIFEDTKNFAVVLTKEINYLELIPEKLYILNGEIVDFKTLAVFKDGTTVDVSEDAVISGYTPGIEGFQTIVSTYNHGQSYTVSKSIEFKFKASPIDAVIEDSERSLTLNLQGTVPFDYKNFRVYKKIEDGSIIYWQPVTTNITAIENRAMLLAPLTSDDELKIEIFNTSGVLVDTIYNSDIKVNFIEQVLVEEITINKSLDVDGNLIVNFNIEINNAIISLNSLYQKYTLINNSTIKYDHDLTVFDGTTIENNYIKVHSWSLLNKTVKNSPTLQEGSLYVFDYDISENSIIIINGKMYSFTIDSEFANKIEIPSLDIPVNISDIEVYEFNHNNDVRIKKYELIGSNVVLENKSIFEYNLRHCIVNYNGLNYKYSLVNGTPLVRNIVQYDVPTDLPVFDDLEVQAITFGYNEISNYINIGVVSD